MKHYTQIVVTLFILTACLSSVTIASDFTTGVGKRPATVLLFQENRGQIIDENGTIRDDIVFAAATPEMRIYLRKDGISYVFRDDGSLTGMRERYRMDMTLEGCNPDAEIRGLETEPGVVHYYRPHCPEGISGIREYRRILYENIYDEIDLELLSNGDRIKYNFIVRPGGNPSMIRMRYDGAEDPQVTASGALRIRSPLGGIEEAAPYSYLGRKDREVASRFVCDGNVVSFAIAPYELSQILVIDPWATYYGGSGTDVCTGIATDASGNVIACGYTASTDFPVSGGFQASTAGGDDAFIVKFDASGTRLWATYFGGSADERAYVTVDGSGNIIIGGTTGSPDLPTTSGTLQPVYGGNTDMYAAKFSAAGTLIWATYVGGSETESNGFNNGKVATDAEGHVLLCGSTGSTDYPVSAGAFQTSLSKKRDMDVCVTSLTSTGTMHWSTYYGSRSGEGANDIATDAAGNVFITGGAGDGFPVTAGAYQTSSAGGLDGFIVKFSSTGQRLWATLVGGSDGDWSRAIATCPEGDVYIAGYTWSPDYPVTPGAFQIAPPSGSAVFDPMITKFSGTGALLWSSYCGGSDNDVALDLAVDVAGNAILTGDTRSDDYPVSAGCLQSGIAGDSEGMVTKFSSTGTLLWSTFCGGSSDDYLRAVAVSSAGEVFLGGLTLSTDFPTYAATQGSLASGPDAVCVALTSGGLIPGYNAPPVAVATANLSQGVIPLTVSFTGDGSHDLDGYIVTYAWDFGDGNTASIANPQNTFTNAGTYTVTLTVTDDDMATATTILTIVAEAAGSYVYVASQQVTRVNVVRNKWKGTDLVLIQDQSANPVSGAIVTATYSGQNSGSTSGVTDATGHVLLETRPSVVSYCCHWWCFTITDVQAAGFTFNSSASVITACEGAQKTARALPQDIEVSVQPNPFHSSALIHYSLPQETHVQLRVYDVVGREVATLAEGPMSGGIHTVWFESSALPNGVYFYRLTAGSEMRIGRMLLVR